MTVDIAMLSEAAKEIAGELSEAQRHFVLMSVRVAQHPYDIDSTGSTAAAMVRRGLAYRAVCSLLGTDEQFNGYGLTPLGAQVRALLLKDNSDAG